MAGLYYIEVKASDSGHPASFSSAVFFIDIYDVNTVIPRFTHPDPSRAIVKINEVSAKLDVLIAITF